ncbi:uncharacterized protein LOC108026095 [Drosophila biarmipes]|uniref:uncharacterized protein LOC108026095 n=1 Tax=Drosophila biarmipes TaxID=125945 RepID=UPI0007E61C03|nr:uncharacterized protein LOC108026095 [Drosophila biarmipes]
MKAFTFLLVVLASASCLLTAQANLIESSELSLDFEADFDYDYEVEQLMDEMDDGYEFMEVEDLGFFRTFRKILWAALRTVLGADCIIREVENVLHASSTYLKNIEGCGNDLPKDVRELVKSVRDVVHLSDTIINLRARLCTRNRFILTRLYHKLRCFWRVFRATLKLVREIPRALRQIAKLPADASRCVVSATDTVKNSYTSFLPNVKVCLKK